MPRLKATPIVALVSTLLLISQVSCSGVFELRLSSFTNELGRDSLGHCCSGYRTSGGKCSGVCRTSFRVCFKHFQNHIDPEPPCTYGDITTPVIANNTVKFDTSKRTFENNFNNPIVFPFNFSWPGTFSLIIEAWHVTPESEKNINGVKSRALIARLATRKWLNVSDGWTGDKHKNNHTDLEFGYRVRCDDNYYGHECADICRPRDDSFGHYKCGEDGKKNCLPGWKGEYCSKAICSTECHEEHGYCESPYQCKCRMGWQGKLCDECIRYPGCSHGTCDQPWQCNCDEGWGGLFCNQDLNYCTNHKPCKNGGTCTNTGQGSYTCTCPEVFTGTDCEIALDDCSHEPCRNGATCITGESNYSCTCIPGFHGRHCEISSASTCSESPCKNQGTCQDSAGGYKCLCQPGYQGINCEMQKDECQSYPCANGASCVNKFNGYQCICQAGYTGPNCDININDCKENVCLNGGSCLDQVNSFKCVCVPGFVGSLCQVNVDDCLTKPCANGGLCHDLVNDYRCTCRPGFTGKDCSANIDECASNPCQHGGICEDRVDEFLCRCPSGFFGQRCELSNGGSYVKRVDERVVDVSRRVAATDERERATELTDHVALIATLACTVPLLILVCLIAVFCLKYRRRKEREREDAEAHLQNEQNRVNSMNNKCLDSQIINTLDRPNSKMSKINNEDSNSIYITKDCHVNHAAIHCNLQRTNKLLNTSSKLQDSLMAPSTEDDRSSQSHLSPSISNTLSSSKTNSHRTTSDLAKPAVDKATPASSVYVIDEHYQSSPISKPELSTQV